MILLRNASNRLENFADQLALASKLCRQWATLHRQTAVCVFLTVYKGGQWFAYDRPDQVPDGAWIVETWVKQGRVWKLVDYTDWLRAAKGEDKVD